MEIHYFADGSIGPLNHPSPFDQGWPTRVWPQPPRVRPIAAEIDAKPFRFEDLNGKPEPEAWGPVYPALPSVEKWRKLNRQRDLSDDEKRAYGAAVGAAIRLLQRQSFAPGRPEIDVGPCDFDAQKHRNKLRGALHSVAARDRAAWARGEGIRHAYEAAMAAKRKREAASAMREAA